MSATKLLPGQRVNKLEFDLYLGQLVIILLFIIVPIGSISLAKPHPFLLLNKEMFSELNQRANQSPWKEWKTESISKCQSLTFQISSMPLRITMQALQEILDSCALAYVLDPSNKIRYKNKIISSIHHWPTLYPQVDPTNWAKTVPPGSAFFISMLALDIIFDDLNSTEQTTAINDLRPPTNPWPFTWPHNYWATHIIWNLFNEDQAKVTWAKNGYRQQLFGPSTGSKLNYNYLQHVTAQGAYGAGSSYGLSKMGCASLSIAKCHAMDLLEFTGEDDYYTDPKARNLYEWLLVFSRNPFGGYTTFGDTFVRSPAPMTESWGTPRFQSIARFSEDLAPLVSWWLKGQSCSNCRNGGLLLSYVLTQKPLPAAKKPTSTLFLDGGAAFWDEDASENALMGAMLNMSISEWHTHKEVNAVYLAGYGEHLLVNAGYAEACCGVNSTFTRSWFGRNANSANTLLIDGVDHSVDATSGHVIPGRGLTEGFTSDLFDYVSGDSGSALPNGHHQRNFIFVHPQDSKNGYFVLLDEVQATATKVSTAHLLLHPLSNQYSTITANQEYQWQINGIFLRNKNKPTYLNVFLATPPKNVVFKDGAHADGQSTYMLAKYLEAVFETNNQGVGQVLTGLFPHDPTHSKPTISRNSSSAYSGMVIDHGNLVKDYAFITTGNTIIDQSGFSFSGRACMVRQTSTQSAQFYFIRQGSSFLTKGTVKSGFSSAQPLSLHVRGRKGRVVSPGTNVTFYYPQISAVLLNNQKITILKKNPEGSIEVFIPQGTHSLELATDMLRNKNQIPKPPTDVKVVF